MGRVIVRCTGASDEPADWKLQVGRKGGKGVGDGLSVAVVEGVVDELPALFLRDGLELICVGGWSLVYYIVRVSYQNFFFNPSKVMIWFVPQFSAGGCGTMSKATTSPPVPRMVAVTSTPRKPAAPVTGRNTSSQYP
jgi:hypothetical protein